MKQPSRPKEDTNLRKEVEILQQLDHPNIVQCVDFFEDDTKFYVVMEFLQVSRSMEVFAIFSSLKLLCYTGRRSVRQAGFKTAIYRIGCSRTTTGSAECHEVLP